MPLKAHLFVYGTLMRQCRSQLGRLQRRRLATESRYIGRATVRGRLYDLGNFPALSLDAQASDTNTQNSQPERSNAGDSIRQNINNDKNFKWNQQANMITGEVIQLLKEQVTLTWLDVYEGCHLQAKTNNSIYRRTTTIAHLETGNKATVWLYVLNTPKPPGQLLHRGHWLQSEK